MNYLHLGRLRPEIILHFERSLRSKMSSDPYQWVYFDEYDRYYYRSVLNNPIAEKIKQQKALISAPGHGFRIHKDEPGALCALNIVVQCNPNDWVRWYDEEYINALSTVENIDTVRYGQVMQSRNTKLTEYESVPCIEEVTNQQPGDVYIVSTDTFHSFKAVGTNDRIVIQTKFWHCPSVTALASELSNNIFADYLI